MDKCHEPLFQHLRNIISKNFNHNIARSSVNYMVDDYGPYRSVWQRESRKGGDRYLEAVLEALERVSKSTF